MNVAKWQVEERHSNRGKYMNNGKETRKCGSYKKQQLQFGWNISASDIV